MITRLRKTVGTFLLTASVFTLAGIATAHAQASASEDSARRVFLTNLGFEDVPKIIREKLANLDFQTELNRRQMEANVVAYEILNASRELAIFTLGEIAPQGLALQSRSAQNLAHVTAKLLALKPLPPPTTYPSKVLNVPEGEAREQALVDWLREVRTETMNQHKSQLVSDFVSTIYAGQLNGHDQEIRKIDRLLTTVVERLYLDDTIGNGRYLGRAFTALIAREEKLRASSGEKPVSDLIASELKSQSNLRLENFIGDTLVLPNDKGDKSYKVENGTMMLSRNLAAGSLQISWAAIPAKIRDRWRARFKGLIGAPIAAGLFLNPEDAANGLSLTDRIRDRIAQGGLLRLGFSHIVYYEVKEDAATGIKMARVIDNYPARVFDSTNEYIRTGGTRLTYPEQVIDMSHHAAVYFANPIAEKTAEWSHKSVAQDGYQPDFFPSIELDLKDGVIPAKNTRVKNWKTTIN